MQRLAVSRPTTRTTAEAPGGGEDAAQDTQQPSPSSSSSSSRASSTRPGPGFSGSRQTIPKPKPTAPVSTSATGSPGSRVTRPVTKPQGFGSRTFGASKRASAPTITVGARNRDAKVSEDAATILVSDPIKERPKVRFNEEPADDLDVSEEQHSEDELLEVVLSKIKAYIVKHNSNQSHTRVTSEKAMARHVTHFLNITYNLSTCISIDDFSRTDKIAEMPISKALSHVALATQQASARYALQANLFQQSIEAVEQQLELTKQNTPSGGEEADVVRFESEFLEPLQRQLDTLRQRHAHVDELRSKAEERFQHLRQQAIKPLMEQLQLSNKSYAYVFRRMDPEALCEEVKKLEEMIHEQDRDSQHTLTQRLTEHNPHVERDANLSQSDAVHTISYLQALYADAMNAKTDLQTLLLDIQMRCKDRGVVVELELGGLKAVETAVEKAAEEYEGDFSRVLDLARGTLVCKTIKDAGLLVKVIADAIGAAQGVDVVRVKNRLDYRFPAAAESGGYRDLLINLRLHKAHVCELQIQIAPFLNVKAGGGHHVHNLARHLYLLDPDLGQVRVSGVASSSTDVRDDLTRVFQRIEMGTCQTLYLNHVVLNVSECRALSLALQSPSSNVREIYMTHCGIDKERGAALFVGLPGNIADFSVVDVSGNKGMGGDCVAAFVSEELEVLRVNDCSIKTIDARAISSALMVARPHRLREIHLNNNGLGSKGGQNILDALCKIPSLSFMDLSANDMGPETAHKVVDALSNCKQMTTLNLEDNQLDDEAKAAIADSLKHIPNLKI